MKFKETINDFLHYLKSPNDEKAENATLRDKVETVIKLFLFSLPIIFAYTLLLHILKKYNILDAGPNINSNLIYKYSYIKLILIGVVLAPLVEELTFRLPLRYKNNYLLRFFVYLIASIGFADEEHLNEKVQNLWQKYFKYFFYLMAFAFACVHFFNFTNHNKLWAWILVLVFAQLLIGAILGYIRVRFSMLWSMLYHALHNFVFFSFALISISPTANYQNKNNDYSFYQNKNNDYSFSFQKSSSVADRGDYSVTIDKVEFKNYKLADALEIIFEKPSKYFLNNGLGEMHVDINFKNKGKQINTAANLKLVAENIRKTLKGKLNAQLIEKNVFELYVTDSLKYKKALSESSGERILNFRQTCRHLDFQYADNYFLSDDSIHLVAIGFDPKVSFDELRKNWKEKYGLGFKQESRKLVFINL